MTAEGTMAPRILSEFMDKYIAPPSRINIKAKPKKSFIHRPVMKVAPEANLATEPPVMILKPLFLVGDLETNNTSSTANHTLIKPKKSVKAKVVGFLSRQSKIEEHTYGHRSTSTPLTKSTPAFAAPKRALRTASVYPIDLVAARRRADEAWAKAEKHSNIDDVQALFDSTEISTSSAPSFLSSSSPSDYTSTSSSSTSWRGRSGIPSPVGMPSLSPRSYTPTRRSLYPFSRPSSPIPFPASSSILVNEKSSILSDPGVAFSENRPEVEASDAGRDCAKQDKNLNIDVAVDATDLKTKYDLLNEQNAPTEELSRATKTIQELMALVQRQAEALEVQKAEIHDQQQTLTMLADQILELEKRPIRSAENPSLATFPPAAYDSKAIIKTIVNEIAANTAPVVRPPAAKYLDKDGLKDLIKQAAIELFTSVPAIPPPLPPPPPPPPPPVPSPHVSKAIKNPVIAKKSRIPRAGAQVDPKFLEELTATIKSFSVPGSRKTSPARSNVSSSCSSPRSLNRITLRHQTSSPGNSSNRSSSLNSDVSSAAASPPWNRSSLRPSRGPVLIPTDKPARKFTLSSSAVARLTSSPTKKRNAVNWGHRVNATVPTLSGSPRDKRLADELAGIKARGLVAGKFM
jgi:hypothetical protein